MNINREHIHIISKHSRLPKQSVARLLSENVYSNTNAWQKFLRIFFLGLGTTFTIAGIIFFFAYNWAQMHRFVKIGMIEGLVVIATAITLLSRLQVLIKNLLLTAAVVLTGVLFAVFGQVYQTGANVYNFFLGWAAIVTIWVLVSNFAPLWLIYLLLINTSVILYQQQVAQNWHDVLLHSILFGINAVAVVFFLWVKKIRNNADVPVWFTHTLSLATASFATIGIITGIFEKFHPSFPVLLAITAVIYTVATLHAIKNKSLFYLSVIAFSVVCILAACMLNISSDAAMILLVSLFIVAAITIIIKQFLQLQKAWNNEQ